MSKVVVVKGKEHEAMVRRGLSELRIAPGRKKIVIKPNLIDNRPYPVTTNAKTVEGIVKYFIDKADEIIIAEGSGWCSEGTLEAFVHQGYMELAKKYNIKLTDLNEDEYEIIENPDAMILKKFELPRTLKDSYLISAPVLKRHSICKVTLSLKNMIGASILSDKGRFHFLGIDESIVDIVLREMSAWNLNISQKGSG
ncbi:MAG: hypothetical protein A7315_13840 [Candidatus Altiarchaeales archaeon WOR_SM1_79]|nr:MAG: hypothetical protein A7315_13840 [Candidatus Altiarchaeales archaeon WOR_SM1_79]